MRIRTSFGFCLFVAAICAAGTGINWLGAQGSAAAQAPGVSGAALADFREQLESGLKARRPEEFEYIGRVVAVVERGELSDGLVKSVFRWAVRQNAEYPFPYFQRAMRILAKERGVKI